ncbi:tetratricopeptide repeat protein 12-like [Belonocnema kinseyi]|uniref:tetratricopeptide repeat protein 12-like n=1 Tax=Belonocnema kinseyi TaxID=2817044 RepID=UPI00143D5B8A|nr:tetratricopeptide repeat protein 12-like [Belonocnema kinseyi]
MGENFGSELTLNEKEKALESILPDKNVTEEEFQNFMYRVTEVEKIVKKLASSNLKEQDQGMALADEILDGKIEKQITEDGEIRIKANRTLVNPRLKEPDDPEKMSQEGFMKSVERDAKHRAEDRKARYERADTYKRIGNGAFKQGDYEKALTYFTKAIEYRKDSSVLWNNRALTYMQLKKFKKALNDCEWALKVNESNLKSLLNSAKCYEKLNNQEKRKQFIDLARERNPEFTNYINDFEKELTKSKNIVESNEKSKPDDQQAFSDC